VQRVRENFPMGCLAKLVVLLRAEGFTLSESTVGRILRHLVARGVVGGQWQLVLGVLCGLRLTRHPQRVSIVRCLPASLNPYRPHSAFQNLTPAQYLATHHGLEPLPSQMS
jgi:hypothetical protein